MKKKLKAFLATPRGKLIAAGSAMAVSLLFLLFNLAGNSGKWFAGKSDLDTLKNDIATAQKQYSQLMQRENAFKIIEKNYRALLATAETPGDSSPESALRGAVEKSAAQAGLQLQSIGAARESTVNSDLAMYEIDFAGGGESAKISEFLLALDAFSPRIFWRKFEIRNGGHGPGPAGITFSGTLGMLIKQSGGRK
ncbi:MAG: hypothetical protein AB7F40_06985 [Victivallaceae bacterium]